MVLALGVEIVGARADVGSYERLLPTIMGSTDDPFFGDDVGLYATTHGLVLSAAVAAGDAETRADARAFLETDHQPGGWGTGWTWDPFADGSPTAAGTPYAITTAIAIDALLDDDIGPEMARAVAADLLRWARDGWADGFYWYSLAPHDAVYVPNVSAMLAGVTARFLASNPADALTPADSAFLAERVASTFQHLAATQIDGLRWSYSSRQSIVNDTGHHVYILWGGERARDAGIDPGWSREEASASLDAYGPVYPPDVAETPAMARRDDSPWETHGTGGALAWSATWGGDLLRWSAAMCESLEVAPRAPRFDAHALLAMALVGWCDCPGRPRLVPGVSRSC